MHPRPYGVISGVALPIADDIDFWSRLLSEHALLIQLGIDDKRLKGLAERLYNEACLVAGESRAPRNAEPLHRCM